MGKKVEVHASDGIAAGGEPYAQVVREERYPGKDRRFVLRFQQNRSFELHVGSTVYAFAPNGSQEVPAWVVEHPDFAQVAGLFGVSEVK